MDTKTKQILAETLLLPKTSRIELLDALEGSLGESPIDLSEVDLSETRAMIDELIEEADKTARRRRDDGDVPELWRSSYYLRQGYHLDPAATGRRDHWQGGAPLHKRAVCPSCNESFRLLWDIDCRDPRFRKESAEAFGKLERLPLYYCLHCPSPTIYRCKGARQLQVIAADSADSDESPFSEIPDVFPRERLVFRAIPSDIENLILICQLVGDDWLRQGHRKTLAQYLGTRSARSVGCAIRRSQFGGIPVLQQDNANLVCPYDKCPTHTWGHPLLRNQHYYQMKLLATIEEDAGLAMQSHGAQIVFHICWACQTIHSDFQID